MTVAALVGGGGERLVRLSDVVTAGNDTSAASCNGPSRPVIRRNQAAGARPPYDKRCF